MQGRPRPLAGPPVILMYHRVAIERSDPWGLCVSPLHFEQHVDVLSRHARTVPLAQLQREMRDGRAAPGSVAITFDDGYADNFLVAEPMLRRGDLPATIFVTSGYTQRGREFWWDELERIFLEPGDLPRSVSLTVGGSRHRLDLDEAAHFPPAVAGRHSRWRAYGSEPPTKRHAAFLAAWEHLVTLRDADQWEALQSLRECAGPSSSPGPSRRTMDAAELVALAEGGLVEIGAHTVTHPALPLFPSSLQRSEIVDGRQALATLLGRPVTSFSYPHGRYTEETVRIVRDAEFTHACAATPGPHSASTADPFTLGRTMVVDGDGDALLRQLTEATHGR